jgi:site-specific DNA recombinase
MTFVNIPKTKFNASIEAKTRILEHLPDTWMKANKVPAKATPPDGKPRRRRAGVYLRFSTDQQDVYSFARQKKAAQEYSDKLDVDIVEFFSDPALSGAYTANRPAYKAMMRAARRKKFELIIVEDGDRLARKLHITTSTFSDLADIGIELHSTRLGKWSLLHAAFVGMMSEEQRRRIAELMRSGIIKIVDKGLWPVSAPLGYEKIAGEPGNMRIVERYADSVRRVFNLRISGLGHYQIADICERENLPTALSKWTGSQVRFLLMNPIYVGIIIFLRTISEKTQIDDDTIEIKKSVRDASDWLYGEREDWRIVTPAMWRAVRAMDVEAPNVGPRAIYLLTKRVFCAECGRRMHIGGGTIENNMVRCSTDNKIKVGRQRLKPCRAPATRLDPLEDEVIRLVCARLNHPEAIKAMQEAHKAKITAESNVLNLERSRLQREKNALHERLDATYDSAMNAGMSSTVLVQQREEYCARIDVIDEELASIPALTISENPLFATPIDSSVFLDELVPGRNYRGCSETVARTVATFQRLVDKIIVKTDASGMISLEITGPIAYIGNNGASSLLINYTPVPKCQNKVRSANLKSRNGMFSIPESDWSKIEDRLPNDPIWIAEFDQPVPIKKVIEAVIASKVSGVGIANIGDAFGSSRQIWAAARICNYGGILDIAEKLLNEREVAIAKGVSLAIDSTRSPLNGSDEHAIERHRLWNERRRRQVARRLAGDEEFALSA